MIRGWPVLLLLACVPVARADVATRPAAVPAGQLDPAGPIAAYRAGLAAMLADDLARVRAGYTCVDPTLAPMLDRLAARHVAEHRLNRVAVERFGRDGERLMRLHAFRDDRLLRQLDGIAAVRVRPTGVDEVVLHPDAISTHVLARLRRGADGIWRHDWSQAAEWLGKDPARVRQWDRNQQCLDQRIKLLQLPADAGPANVEAARTAFVLLDAEIDPPPSSVPEEQLSRRWLERARQADLTPAQRFAYRQLAELPACDVSGAVSEGLFDLGIPVDHPSNAIARLTSMGLDVLPVLVEALDDPTPTATFVKFDRHGHDVSRRHNVNDVVARIIWRMTEFRSFSVWSGADEVTLHNIADRPEAVAGMQKVILAWLEANRRLTLAERHIAALADDNHSNRFRAIRWLVERQHLEAVPALAAALQQRIDDWRADSTSASETATLCQGLADLHAVEARKTVAKAAAKLCAAAAEYGSGWALYSVNACQALVRLGDRKLALEYIGNVEVALQGRLEPHQAKAFALALAGLRASGHD